MHKSIVIVLSKQEHDICVLFQVVVYRVVVIGFVTVDPCAAPGESQAQVPNTILLHAWLWRFLVI